MNPWTQAAFTVFGLSIVVLLVDRYVEAIPHFVTGPSLYGLMGLACLFAGIGDVRSEECYVPEMKTVRRDSRPGLYWLIVCLELVAAFTFWALAWMT